MRGFVLISPTGQYVRVEEDVGHLHSSKMVETSNLCYATVFTARYQRKTVQDLKARGYQSLEAEEIQEIE